MAACTEVGVEYVGVDGLDAYRASGWQGVLGIAAFGQELAMFDTSDVPVACIGTRPLAGPAALFEVWRAPGDLRSGVDGLVCYRTNGHLILGMVTLNEADVNTGAGEGQRLREATARIYQDIFRCVRSLGRARVIKMWNYIPEITGKLDGVERYRHFNAARQRAFQSCQLDVRGGVPAACALGSPPGGPLVVYFLASTGDVAAIENPRQVSAYDYPDDHGAYSPTFSRATVSGDPSSPMLFISGTASIVGHRTVHPGDVLAQTRESVANIRALVGQVNRAMGASYFVLERLQYKTYVRRLRDLEVIASELCAAIHPSASVVFLQADICRPDLLVEIEAAGATEHHREH